jgi:hypothetical protein
MSKNVQALGLGMLALVGCAGNREQAKPPVSTALFSEVIERLLEDLESSPIVATTPFDGDPAQERDYRVGFRLGYSHAIMGGLYPCGGVDAFGRGYKEGQWAGRPRFEATENHFTR